MTQKIISRSFKTLHESTDEVKLHTPIQDKPSTSHGTYSGTFKRQATSSDDEIELENVDDMQYMVKKQITLMKYYLEDEAIYIECFKKLIDIETERKSERNTLQLKNGACYVTQVPGSVACLGHTKIDTDTFEMCSIHEPIDNNLLDNWNELYVGDSNYTNPKLKGKKSDRTKLRKELLSKIETCYDNHEMYQSFFDTLVDIEESFVI